MKYFLWGAVGIAGIAGGAYLYRMNRLSDKLEVVTKAIIYKVSLTGLRLRIDVKLKNPTGGTMKLKYPFVKLLYGASTLGSSQVKDQDYEIPKFGELTMEPIYIDLGFISLAGSAPGLVKEYRSTGGFTLNIETVTTVNNILPYTKKDQIAVGNSTEQKA